MADKLAFAGIGHWTKTLGRELLPPALAQWIRPFVAGHASRQDETKAEDSISFVDGYKCWEDAARDSTGYDSPDILNRVRAAVAAVRDGVAAAERDGVAFETPQWNFPLLACLSRVPMSEGRPLRVLDLGGSLGGTYFSCRAFFGQRLPLAWHIVEQEHFVRCGREEFETAELKYHASLEDCFALTEIDVVLLSAVLPYLPDPYQVLNRIASVRVPQLMIDRTPLIDAQTDRLTVQHVPGWIYGAPMSYPAWFFSRARLEHCLSQRYSKQVEFTGQDGEYLLGSEPARFFGQLWKLH